MSDARTEGRGVATNMQRTWTLQICAGALGCCGAEPTGGPGGGREGLGFDGSTVLVELATVYS